MNDNNYLIGRILKSTENYWIISCVTNAIWKCDLDFNVVDYIVFREEDAIEDLFRAALIVDNTLYCFAYNARKSYCINTITGEMSTIEDDTLHSEVKVAKYSYAVPTKDAIIVIGRNVHGFIKYDLNTRKAKLVVDGWSSLGNYTCSFTHCIDGNMIYTVSILDSQSMGIDIQNNKIVSFSIEDCCDKNLATIMSDGRNICITNDRCEVITVDRKFRAIEKRKIEGWNENSIRLSGIYNQRMWFVGNKTGELVIEEENGFSRIALDVEMDEHYCYCFSDAVVFENDLFLQSRKNGDIIHYNFDSGCMEKINIRIGNDIKDKYLVDLIDSITHNAGIIREDKEMNVRKLIAIL